MITDTTYFDVNRFMFHTKFLKLYDMTDAYVKDLNIF